MDSNQHGPKSLEPVLADDAMLRHGLLQRQLSQSVWLPRQLPSALQSTTYAANQSDSEYVSEDSCRNQAIEFAGSRDRVVEGKDLAEILRSVTPSLPWHEALEFLKPVRHHHDLANGPGSARRIITKRPVRENVV
jgi:hypothetical protein